jgi:hypothetical protein
VQHGILRDVFVQDANLVDAVHEAPRLCNRRPGKPARFVKGFEPLLYFKRLDVDAKHLVVLKLLISSLETEAS